MNLRTAAREAVPVLEAAGIDDARFEAELLARHAGRLERDAYFRTDLDDARSLKRFACALDRRLAREPAAYILKSREFYGLDFAVGKGVLIPRPETELLVDAALSDLPTMPGAIVLDVGTGSGAVAVSIAAHAPGTRVLATEVSPLALRYARKNARRHGPGVSFVRGSLAACVASADIVLANLPYIPSAEVAQLQPEIRDWEPSVALDGGADGLALIRELVADCATRLRPRLLALEVALHQADMVSELCAAAGASVETRNDLAGIPRAVLARWR